MLSKRNIMSHFRRIFCYRRILGEIGSGTILRKPLEIKNPKSISIGQNTFIGEDAWLIGSDRMTETLKIGNKVQIGHYSHIVALNSVQIEDAVLLADKVYISDCGHQYDNINVPILEQPMRILGQVVIGEGAWLGENVSVIGASVGKHSIIGANSVVTKDIPNYCVAVGCPAKVIKKYDFEQKEWVSTNKSRGNA